MTNPPLPRGLRNNNPGNIKVGDSWQGAVGSDGTFIIFQDTTWGLRAIGRALTNMIGKGYDTIATLIPQWSATDQAAYVANVAAATGLDPSVQLGTDPDTLGGIIRAICNQENGANLSAQYISDADIAQGISMIGLSVQTVAAAAAVEVQSNPLPYIGAAVLLGILIWQLSKNR